MTIDHGQAFVEEAHELLADLENSLLELEETPDDKELIGSIFRSMHTIKGSGAMFGFDEIAAFTHEVETVYDKVREGHLPITAELINLTLHAKDRIKFMLDGPQSGEAPDGLTSGEIVAAFQRLALGTETRNTTPLKRLTGSEGASPPPLLGHDATFRIRFVPSRNIFLSGTNPLLLLDELRALGECEVTAQLDDIPPLQDINPEECYVGWDIVLTTGCGMNAIKDVFIFVEDGCQLTIEGVDREAHGCPEPTHKKLGEILLERGDVEREGLSEALSEQRRLGEILVDKRITTSGRVESALAEQEHVKKARARTRPGEDSAASIRVPADKLDVLVNLVGELVTVQARLSQTASLLNHVDLTPVAEEVERLTAELRDNTLNIRMLPIGTTFGRFKRLIHDLSQELGKEIEMTTEGAETELDKTVIERLNDPLVHLIRNCIDHGIESPEERESAGKPRVGSIDLSAVHSGAQVIIRISDDGRGLDREAILSKAIERGLALPNAEHGDKEVFGFIFQPGFSTAREVTNVSGRGVGMDVARRAIEALRGSIEVTSEKGRGTTVTIRLPLTLAIVEGLLVALGQDSFVLPLTIVEECVELSKYEASQFHGRNLANIRGEIVPYIRLRREFGIEGEPPPIEQIVVAGINGARIGFVVDKVIGEHQTVIKNLGRLYRSADAVSGATILGDGTVALIVDVAKLTRNSETTPGRSN
jgi:two-component system chemotaxis sensor kinase CheA